MRENKEEKGREAHEERQRCQIAHVRGKAPSSSCAEPPKEMVDGLVLCEGHALEAKLEGQIACWGEMLFHIDLWAREAARRDRQDVVGLLDVERAEATSARQRAYEDLDVLRRRSGTPWGVVSSGGGGLSRRGSLPPRAARPLALGLRHLRRR